MNQKKMFVSVCQAAQSIAYPVLVQKPLSFQEMAERFQIVEQAEDGPFEVSTTVCRMAVSVRAEEILQGVIEKHVHHLTVDHFPPYLHIIRPFFGDSDIENGKLKAFQILNAMLRLLPRDQGIDEEAIVDSRHFAERFACCIFNNASLELIRMEDKPAGMEALKTFCRCVVQMWQDGATSRARWQAQSSKETVDGIETVINTLRGLVRIVSAEPGDCMSEIEHLELAFPQFKFKTAPNLKPPTVHLGTMAGDAGKVMASHIQKSEGWRNMRVKAEASKNVDRSYAGRFRAATGALDEAATKQAFATERTECLTETMSAIKEFKLAGMRDGCCSRPEKKIVEIVSEDLTDLEEGLNMGQAKLMEWRVENLTLLKSILKDIESEAP